MSDLPQTLFRRGRSHEDIIVGSHDDPLERCCPRTANEGHRCKRAGVCAAGHRRIQLCNNADAPDCGFRCPRHPLGCLHFRWRARAEPLDGAGARERRSSSADASAGQPRPHFLWKDARHLPVHAAGRNSCFPCLCRSIQFLASASGADTYCDTCYARHRHRWNIILGDSVQHPLP